MTAAEEICRTGRSLFERGYAHGTAGAVSVRIDEGVLITPTDACLGSLDAERLVLVAPDGTPVRGGRPSKTLALHRRIYAADPSARCVVHTHSRAVVAATLRGGWRDGDLLPPVTPYFVMKVGHVPLVPYRRPGDPRTAEAVAGLIAGFARRGLPLAAVALERLGPVVWHDSPAAAAAVLEELEETARLWLRTGADPLPPAALADLEEAFGRRW